MLFFYLFHTFINTTWLESRTRLIQKCKRYFHKKLKLSKIYVYKFLYIFYDRYCLLTVTVLYRFHKLADQMFFFFFGLLLTEIVEGEGLLFISGIRNGSKDTVMHDFLLYF